MQENPFSSGKKNYCTFYIVRHGETQWNVKKIIQGQSIDSSLTNVGIKQVEKIAKEFKKIKFDSVYSSDLLRAKRTAEIIALEHKLAVVTNKILRERKYGSFEGKSTELLHQFDYLFDILNEKERSQHKIDRDAESDEELMTRFITFLREAAITHPQKTILVVTHGGLMRVFLHHLGFVNLRYFRTSYISHTAYIKLLSDGVEFFIEETKGIRKDVSSRT